MAYCNVFHHILTIGSTSFFRLCFRRKWSSLLLIRCPIFDKDYLILLERDRVTLMRFSYFSPSFFLSLSLIVYTKQDYHHHPTIFKVLPSYWYHNYLVLHFPLNRPNRSCHSHHVRNEITLVSNVVYINLP